jgi:type 2A phosphatase activator TIP41
MDTFTAGSWDITVKQGRMLGSEAIDALSGKIGVKVPEIVFLDSVAKFTNTQHGIDYFVSVTEALELTGYQKRNSLLYTDGEIKPDSISMLPRDLKVANASHWQGRTIPKGSNFTDVNSELIPASVCDFGNDWTYSTPYKGTIESTGPVQIQPTNESIPLERLGPNNPILWGGEVIFYEAELDDCGQCKFGLRVRSMSDCFFALLRLYLRVDHVVYRIFDTRIFHSFDTRYLLREFQAREATYEEIQATLVGPQLSINPRQSDLVFEHLHVIHSFKDKISY